VKQDPLALALFGAALALLAGLLFYVFFVKAPEPAPPSGTAEFLKQARRQAAAVAERFQEKPAAEKLQKVPQVRSPSARPAPSATRARPAANTSLEAGHTWRYAVVVDPPAWRDITLTYRTQRENAGIGVVTDFVYAGGKMNFHLGTFAAGHPSHANTRFPGFFMHPSYFSLPLQPGQKLSWGWVWQPAREGRVKRYEGKVVRVEDVAVPAGTYRAAVIEAELSYIEGGQVRARARETLWYAPAASQIVKVVREGRTPDEGSSRIVAELVEFR
jgi:hypothetical protein